MVACASPAEVSASWLDAACEDLAEVHLFSRLGVTVLFNVETSLAYEVTPLVAALIGALREGAAGEERIAAGYEGGEVAAALAALREQDVVRPRSTGRRPALKRRAGLRHLELMVTHACNLRCRYCYGASIGAGSRHLYGADAGEMPWEVARAGVDSLVDRRGRARELSVVFFGGEPLLAMDLIRRVAAHIRSREQQEGVSVELSLSTNGIGLDDEVIATLEEYRIGCQVSIDGPPAIHNANRPTPAGDGSYERVIAGVRRLLAARPGRVTARVTASHAAIDLPGVVDHLLSLGFSSVHVEPCVGGDVATAVTGADIEAMCAHNEELATLLLERVRSNRVFAYHNLVRFIRHTRVVRQRLAHHCGAARTMAALARDGGYYPCHRFVGMPEYRMGDVWQGFDPALQRRVLALTVDNRPGCRECWARYLCGGGCWKHAADAHGCLDEPDQEISCRLIRHQIECALAINGALAVDDAEILSRTYRNNAAPYLLEDQGVTL